MSFHYHLPVFDVSNDAAALTRIVHLHFLHILQILLVHHHHWVRLRQHDQSRMVEHSRNNRSAFDQPICVSKETGTIQSLKTYQTSGNKDFEGC